MSDKPTAEILNFSSSSLSSTSDITPVVPSHLSQTRTRSEVNKPNVKRVKPNTKRRDEGHSMRQLQISRGIVDEVIDLVLNSQPLKYGYGFYYQKVESICKYKHVEQSRLGDFLKQKIESSFYDTIKPAIISICHQKELGVRDFVEKYLTIYQDWEFKLRVLGKLFLYIDRSYLLQHPNRKVILELGLDLFVSNLLVEPVEEASITILKYTQFLEHCQLNKDTTPPQDYELLESLSRILVKLNFDKRIKLDTTVINSIASLFDKFKGQWIKDPQTYIHKSLSKMSEIITFYKECGQSKEFCESLLTKLKWKMIFSDFNQIIESCLPYMLQPENEKQLVMIYRFCKTSLKDYSCDTMLIFVCEWGKLISHEVSRAIHNFNDTENNASANAPKTIVPSLVKINDDFNAIVRRHFEKNEKFEFEIRNAFHKSLNADRKSNSFIMTQLCKFIEGYFRAKKTTATPFKQFEADFLVIFKYLNNKNDFILIYKRELSKRLLLSKNLQIDLEKTLADSMIAIVGETDDSIGLSVMFKDLKVSNEKYDSKTLMAQLNSSIEFQPLVLEQKHWPEIPKINNSFTKTPSTSAETGIIMPPLFASMIEGFSTIYKQSEEKLKNHRLDWDNYQLHQLTITGHFESGDYELQVNLLQAIIIELFTDRDEIKVSEIITLTNMDSKLLKRILHSLTEKYNILLENKSTQTITFNKHFSDKSKKLRIPIPRTIDREVGLVEEKKISKNRDLEIRGTVIRIIKVDTKLEYTDLINKTLVKTTETGRGPITMHDIKSNIEYLIQNEFITRDMDHTMLTYVP